MRGRMKLRALMGPYRGQVIEYSTVAGQSMLDAGYAELVEEQETAPVIETATLPVGETPEAPAARAPRRRAAKD